MVLKMRDIALTKSLLIATNKGELEIVFFAHRQLSTLIQNGVFRNKISYHQLIISSTSGLVNVPTGKLLTNASKICYLY